MGNLSRLTTLWISDNQLTGTIPKELGNLVSLTSLSLWGNQLSGEIPPELGDLNNLRSLVLGTNRLTGEIPTQLGDLSSLTYLSLTQNELTGTIPGALGNLSYLQVLALGGNQLTGSIPSELGNLFNLTGLYLWGNQLTGEVPVELGDLSNLWSLYLSTNQLTGILPYSFTNLTDLGRLYFQNNAGLCAPADDTFQTWLRGIEEVEGETCPNIEDFAADRDVLVTLYNATDGVNWTNNSNWLSDLPMKAWHGVTTDFEGRVSRLKLPENQLSGQLPAELGNLSNLTSLNLTRNELTGTIPTQLSNLSYLTLLALGGNQLTGTIPTQLGNLSNLTGLYLWGNELTGTVPAQLGNLSNLTLLSIQINQLTGELPSSLTGLTSMDHLTFHSNAGLCAPIDNTFQTWLQGIGRSHGSSCAPQDSQDDKAVLTQFYNATDGTNWENKSNWLSNQPIRAWHGVTNDANGRVTGLYLGDNQLSGTIPSELGNLSELSYINLRNNQLTGSIPSELGNLSNLEGLFLGNNQFTGCIPAALQDVEFNDFDDVGLPFCAPQTPGAPTVSTATAGTPTVRLRTAIPVTATFSEPVNGFTASDITVANGDVSNFVGSDGSSVFTFDVTPNAIGVVTVDIAAGVAQDSDNNGNAAAAQLVLGLPYDDDHDGAINREEVVRAIGDHLFSNLLTREQVVQLIGLHLFG